VTQRIFLLPDFQIPDQENPFIDELVNEVRRVKPDVLIHVGDYLDAKPPARWSKGYAEEYSGTLQKDIDLGVDILRRFRDVHKGKPFHLKSGNHDERIETYLHRYAPALVGLRSLDLGALLHLEELDVVLERRPFPVAPGWMVAHGHESGLSITAGGTALGLARKLGKSVVCGHTHRAGIQHDNSSVNGKVTRRLFGMEVGHAMDLRKADYLKFGGANWQQAWGLLEVDGRKVKPILHFR
jgi:predicted phosphodiesterase